MTDRNDAANINGLQTNDSPMNNNNISNNNNNDTTTPAVPKSILKIRIPPSEPEQAPKQIKPVKKKRRDKSDLGDNFVAPDGGWGWLVSIAAGINVLTTFALGQQFGIVFRGHMLKIGITNSELTTIINIQIAVSAFTGLLNGPLFRRYSYRQVALVGSFLTFAGLFAAAFAPTFMAYVWSYSCCYGFGRGLTVSASSLAVNTFFKQKRRTATAYQYGVAGLGPIFLPYFATYMLQYFGVMGTVLLFAAISLHTFACSLVYQPVKWHVKKPMNQDAEALSKKDIPYMDDDDDDDIIDQPTEPDTPTLPRANDGWYGSRTSLTSANFRNRVGTWDKQLENGNGVELKRLNSREAMNAAKKRSISISHSIKEEDDDEYHANKEHTDLQHDLDNEHEQKHAELQALRKVSRAEMYAIEVEERKKLPFYRKVIVFFDFDLLRDITYVNLSMGLTLINFVEVNFAILTPFILSDFGFDNSTIALAMSLLGFFDLVIRFLIPLITSRLTFSNKTLFMIGIFGMCVGRFFLAFTRDFYTMIGIFLWLGLNKAFRTVFWSLIIPGYVPLKRLPAAAGLQLLMSGLFSMAFGPLIGLIRDNTNYAFTLHFLNALCILALCMWILESFLRKVLNKKKTTLDGDAAKN